MFREFLQTAIRTLKRLAYLVLKQENCQHFKFWWFCLNMAEFQSLAGKFFIFGFLSYTTLISVWVSITFNV